MIARKLLLDAFGPYSGKQEIDFSLLKERNLFLITGATGSGKTSILDAISYALYGSASVDGRNPKMLKSDFASNEKECSVLFEFSLGDKIYRVERKPEQEIRKKRGDGFTKKASYACLYEIDENGKVLKSISEKSNSVTEEVENLFGFKADQFRQVVMLPQGQFRRFLDSPGTEREEILKNLFKTHYYVLIEDKLKEKTKELNRGLELIRNDIIRRLEDFSCEKPEDFKVLEDDLKKKSIEKEKLISELIKSENASRKKLDLELMLNQKFIDLEESEKKLMELNQDRELINNKTGKLKNARLALKHKSLADIISLNKEKVLRLKEKLNNNEAEIKTAVLSLSSIDEELEKLDSSKAEIEKIRIEFVHLEKLKDKLALYLQNVESCKVLEAETNELNNEIDKQKKLVEKYKKTIEEKGKELSNTKNLYKKKEVLASAAIKLEKAINLLDELNKAETLLQNVESEFDGKKNNFDELQSDIKLFKETQKVQRNILDNNKAYEIAAALEDGKACPVCGSKEHPFPAKAPEEPIDPDAAVEVERKIEKLLGEEKYLAAEIAGLEVKRISFLEKIKEIKSDKNITAGKSLEKMRAEKNNFEDEINIIENKIAESDSFSVEIEAEKKQVEDAEKALDEMRVKNESISREYAEKKALVKSFEEESSLVEIKSENSFKELLNNKKKIISEYEKKYTDLKNRKEKNLSDAESLKTLNKEYSHQLENIEKLVKADSLKLDDEIKADGFASMEDFFDAFMNQAEIENLEKTISDFNKKYENENGIVIKLKKELKDIKKPDVETLQNNLEEIKSSLNSAREDKTKIDSELERLNTTRDKINLSLKQFEKKEKEYTLIGGLKDIACGNNSLRLSFHRFVLASFLDDVLSAASLRLKKMTGGRYYLNRKTEISDSRPAGGLDIEVFDNYTGILREVKSLSGGESFMASLSLAIGMADVVQSYSGGIRLDTIFIDEGFGSLDPEALDAAINVLVQIQESGRSVGIISHVPELKERIQCGFEVQKSENGSKIKAVVY